MSKSPGGSLRFFICYKRVRYGLLTCDKTLVRDSSDASPSKAPYKDVYTIQTFSRRYIGPLR